MQYLSVRLLGRPEVLLDGQPVKFPTRKALALLGDRSAALQAYDACTTTLAAELGVTPAPATSLLAETIRLAAPASPAKPRHSAPRSEAKQRLPMVGRADDYAGLVAAYADASDGTLHTVVVAGEAGMGKTRLVDEFLNWAVLQGADVLQGRAFEAAGQLPYQPIIMALRARLERENAPEDLLADVWLAELSRLLPELLERYPDLSQALVSVGNDQALAAARLYEAVARLGSALSKRRSLVLFLDDWQWADAASMDLLQYLPGRVAANGRDYAGAHVFYRSSLAICRDIGHQRGEVLALRSLGHLFADQNQSDEARRLYEEALPLARALLLSGNVLEWLAGLAEVAVTQGRMAQGWALVTEALDNLTVPALAQANEPLRAYLTCFRVLRSYDAERAVDLLASAQRLMQDRTATLPDTASRQAFWQNGPTNRALVREFENSKAAATLRPTRAI